MILKPIASGPAGEEADSSQCAEPQPKITTQRIKDMRPDDTPRERAERHGCAVLSVPDLWAIILRTGTQGKPITELCRELMAANDDHLTTLERRSRGELLNLKGLGPLKVLQIQAVMELIRRYCAEAPLQNPKVKCSRDIFQIMRPKIGFQPHEEIWAMLLNRRLEATKCIQLSKGGTTSTTFDIKILLKEAILEGSCSIALCHNHPSGNLQPSGPDDNITKKCKEAAATLDITLIDHLILTSSTTDYYSYSDNGRL